MMAAMEALQHEHVARLREEVEGWKSHSEDLLDSIWQQRKAREEAYRRHVQRSRSLVDCYRKKVNWLMMGLFAMACLALYFEEDARQCPVPVPWTVRTVQR